ncbi:Tyrosine recombinase XerC [Pandoraea morbifera]|uniref:Tyrosine recombinase XerC n=1 Tax=Pandoraea morbifera TaxID=2508300 RepID=A0A5E4UAX3_9BURK|nr:site-specific integrase [Pandoraea morbifera]VVD95359.1 Tyrosine recombinase XerC [Pandoraea morbifera]
MAALTKTPSGTWKATIRRVGWPTTAKTFRTKRDAEDWARRTEDEMVRGVFIQRAPSERTTIASALERYVKEIVPTKKASTQRREQARVATLLSAFGKYSLAAVTPDLIGKFRDQRLAEGKANNTVRLDLALLGHLFTVAIKEWHIGLTYNPVANVRKPSPGEGRDRRINHDEQTRLLATIDKHSNPMMGQIVRIAIETGMRQSEILGIRRSQVDLVRRVVRLLDTKNDTARTVPLNKQATIVFAQALACPIRPIDTDLLFFGEPGKDGKRRPYQFTKAWNIIKKGVGLSDLRFHDLRHEAVSRLIEMGLSDQEAAAISGHKSMQMLRRYTHLRAEDLVKRLDTLSA